MDVIISYHHDDDLVRFDAVRRWISFPWTKRRKRFCRKCIIYACVFVPLRVFHFMIVLSSFTRAFSSDNVR